MIKNISNLGDSALYCDFGKEVNKEINSNVINYFKNIKERNINGVTNITPSYNKLIITYNLSLTNFDILKEEIKKIKLKHFDNSKSKTIKIPICCDKEFALDIKSLEKKLNNTKEEIYLNFFDKEYFCYMTGFVAGMPFLGDIDKKIQTKRLKTPRVKVPKGSVGITEQFCNIYTFESPGGWNIIGNTPTKVFDKLNVLNPALINPGDRVSFYKISRKEYDNWNEKK
jgi:KipI family sensor histidine kinase inhibitor